MHRRRRPAAALVLAMPLAAALLAGGCAEKSGGGSSAEAPKSPATEPAAKAQAPAAPTPAAPSAEAPKPATPPAAKEPEKPAAPAPTVAAGNKPGLLVPEFAATAHRFAGESVTDEPLDSRKAGGVTVWMVSSSTCPYTKMYAPRVVELEDAYAAKGVRFVHVYPNRTESVESKRKFHQQKGFRGAWIEDHEAAIAKALDAKKTPEIYVTAADGVIAYRGAIDDSEGDLPSAQKHYLRDALDAVLAGKPVAVKETVPAG